MSIQTKNGDLKRKNLLLLPLPPWSENRNSQHNLHLPLALKNQPTPLLNLKELTRRSKLLKKKESGELVPNWQLNRKKFKLNQFNRREKSLKKVKNLKIKSGLLAKRLKKLSKKLKLSLLQLQLTKMFSSPLLQKIQLKRKEADGEGWWLRKRKRKKSQLLRWKKEKEKVGDVSLSE